jgi:hypothetical protein
MKCTWNGKWINNLSTNLQLLNPKFKGSSYFSKLGKKFKYLIRIIMRVYIRVSPYYFSNYCNDIIHDVYENLKNNQLFSTLILIKKEKKNFETLKNFT